MINGGVSSPSVNLYGIDQWIIFVVFYVKAWTISINTNKTCDKFMFNHGGGIQCVKELRIHVRTTTILYMVLLSKKKFHMLSLCNFLLWVNKKGACITYNSKLPILPYPTLL